ncbi:phosphotransferase enzyme family-domain-containing protein [Apiospora arundinis]|uniref:Phosphotransferase enzyme family-domain-containing protein n=1 Tax=Apiospora arundinis TaxID=335852 RepID=A0ABR2HL09_9PEZI
MEDTSRQQPLFRWSAGYVEWLLEPEDQIAAIRDLLQIQLKRVWALSLEANDIVVEFIAEGTWNRAFKVTLPPGLSLPFPTKDQYQHQYCRHLVFRLSLPVLKSSKTRSEVTTLRWVRHHTAIPVPRVFLVMDLYGTPPLGTAEQKPVVRLGPLCAQQYMGDWRPEYPFPRGPFRDLRHFCHSFLDVVRYELRDIRQEQRAYIWELCGDIHYEDIEYQIKRPNAPSCQVKCMQRRLNEETPEDKCERQKELVRHKAELRSLSTSSPALAAL